MAIKFHFDAEKALEAIIYVANRLKRSDIYSICKVFYLADKEHLEKFGRTICGDDYCAMPRGPVPTKTYDILKDVRENRDNPVIDTAKAAFTISKYRVMPKRDANTQLLSESDEICINKAIELYECSTIEEKRKLIHDDAYNSTYDRKRKNIRIPYEKIIAKLKEPELLVEYLKE